MIEGALKKDGMKLYERARKGLHVDETKLEPRKVTIYSCQRIKNEDEDSQFPRFNLDIECGGGTYVRSLVRDVGYELGTVATTISLERTKQGQFLLDQCLAREQLSPDSIYEAIKKNAEHLHT